MNDRHTTVTGMNLVRAVCARLQTSGRCGWRAEGSAFENNMKARMTADAYYTSVAMPRV